MSYDKQVVRDWAQDLGTWDKTPPGPEVPPEIVAQARKIYIDMYELLTGDTWT